MFEYLVLSGGSARGLAYIGILEYLQEYNLLKNIKEFVGCSIGAFSALLMILGYDNKELKEIFCNYDLENLKKFKLSNILNKYGLDSGDRIKFFIKTFLKNKNFSENITFKQLYNKTNKKLIVTVTNLNKKETVFLSVDTRPNMKVYIAIQMSMCIPLIFQPILYNKQYYVDGFLTCNFPLRYFFDKDIDHSKILAILLESNSQHNNIDVFEDYIYNVLQCSFSTIKKIESNIAKSKNINIINLKINVPGNFNLNISPDNKKKIFKDGYDNLKYFLQNI